MLKRVEQGIESMVFWSRWLQAPLYVGLIIAQVAYTCKFMVELWHLIQHTSTWDGKLFLGGVLELIDFVMVANLIIMVVIGGYATFVSKLDLVDNADRPDWLDHIDPGSIKIKLAGSLIGISSIQLLQSFIQIGSLSVGDVAVGDSIVTAAQMDQKHEQMKWQIVLHLVFLVSVVMLAITEFIMHRRHRPGEEPRASDEDLAGAKTV